MPADLSLADTDKAAASTVTAVVFDVGQVLFAWDMRCLYAKLIDDSDELEWFVTTVVTPEWHYQHDQGRTVADMVAERSAEYPAYAGLIAAWGSRFNETLPGPVPGSLELVEALHARGVPLYAITNFGAELWERFRPTQPVFGRFRDIVVSGVERLVKPDPAIYQLAQRRFDLPPQAMLFIDDNPANIAAVRACGWHGHLFTDAPTLERDLRRHGLL